MAKGVAKIKHEISVPHTNHIAHTAAGMGKTQIQIQICVKWAKLERVCEWEKLCGIF